MSLLPIQALAVGLPAMTTLVSSFIIGNVLGSSALASIGFAGPFMFVISGFSSLISVGAQILCGKYLGSGNDDSLKKTFNTACVMCFIFGSLLVLFTSFFPSTLAELLGTSGELKAMTSDYIRGYSLCCLFSVFSATLIPFLQLDCAKILSTISIVTLVALNIIFNLLNAFVFHLGMYGVGLASSISSAISVLICVPYFAGKSKLFSFEIKSFSLKEVKRICLFGINSAIIFLWLTLRDRIFVPTLMSLGGTVAISAFTIANNISNSIGCTIQGGVQGTCNLVSSILVGSKDVESLRKLPGEISKTITPFFALCYLIVFALAKPIALAFGAEPEHIALYVLAIRYFNFWFFPTTIRTLGVTIYNSLNKVKTTGVLNFLVLLAYPVSVYLTAKQTNSIKLMYLSAFISELLLVITLYVYYAVKMKRFPKSLSEYVYISRDFAHKKEDCLALTIKTNKEAVESSEKLIEFSRSKGLSETMSYYCGLCLEEMTTDTINRVFPKSKKKSCSIDVRITYENNRISIMLRDDCDYFNPNEWLELYAKDDPMRSIGIKMVKQLADEMDYKSTLGLNVLNISFSLPTT